MKREKMNFPAIGFNPDQFRQMMSERLKEQLGVGEDEWKIIEPRLTKVTTLQREAAGGGRGGFGGFGGFGGSGRGGSGRGGPGRGGPGGDPGQRGQRGQRGGGEAREMNATQAATQALREILEKDEQQAAISGSLKLLARTTPPRPASTDAYVLARDAGERHPLAVGTWGASGSRLYRALLDHHERRASGAEAGVVELDPARREQLRALGYAE